jgi:catechol 2,3-dioxygenase-like lactoylglutathione lyase family enzyme
MRLRVLFAAIMMGVAMAQAPDAKSQDMLADAALRGEIVTVRYQVADVNRSIEFYRDRLGFILDMQAGPAFASVSKGNLRLILGGPGSSGSRPMPDGAKQSPGGWNRILLYVDDLSGRIDQLKTAGVSFRNTIEKGPGGSQILINDPDGNPIELHEAPKS